MTTNLSALWFWRLMFVGPAFALLICSVVLYYVWLFPEVATSLPPKAEDGAYIDLKALRINFSLLAVLSCLAIAGVKATSLWHACLIRNFALWLSGPFFFHTSEDIMRYALGCTFYNTPPVPALYQVKADLRLPFPDRWPLAMPRPLG